MTLLERESSRPQTQARSRSNIRPSRATQRGTARFGARPHVNRSPAHSPVPRSPLVWGFLVVLGGGGALAVLLGLGQIATVLTYAGVAFFLTLAVEPLINWAVQKGFRRGAAVSALVLAMVVILGGISALVVPALQEQLALLIKNAPTAVDTFFAQGWVSSLLELAGGGGDLESMLRDGLAFLTEAGTLISLGGGLLSVGQGVVSGVTAVIVVLVVTLYFAGTFPSMMNTLYLAVAESKRAKVVALCEEIFGSVGRYVAGQLSLAILNGLFVFLVLTIAGGPSPLLLGFITFVGAMIPVVGTVASFAIVTVSTLFVSPWMALVVGLILLAYAQIEAYVLTPRVMSKAVTIPGSLVVLAAFAGAAMGGIIGALVAVPVTASLVIVYQRVIVPAQAQR